MTTSDPAATGTPTLVTRLRSWLKREVTAADLEALRRSGSQVYAELDAAQAQRDGIIRSESDPWGVPLSVQAQLLSFWIAYSLQTLGEAFLDADYALDAGTVGYVPQVTYDQVLALLDPVDEWVSRARQARVNPSGYRLDTDLVLPVELPEWVEVEPCPNAHLQAMLAAAAAMRARTEATLAVFERFVLSKHESDRARLRQLMEAANAAADTAVRLRGDSALAVSDDMHERIEESVKAAIAAYFLLGQLTAMPSLIAGLDRPRRKADRRSPATPASLPLPGQRGFDM